VRRWILTDVDRLPAPAALVALGGVAARRLARMAGATGARVRADLAALPGQLDRVDELLAAGLLGGPAANAADLQIGTAVRVLLAFEDLSPLVDGRPAARHARSVLPDYPEPIPAFLPRHWLPA
jgi:glutathione S-transferase